MADPNKQPVDTAVCPAIATLLMAPWTVSAQGVIAFVAVTCCAVTGTRDWSVPVQLALQPTPLNGRCWWFLIEGGATPDAEEWKFVLGYNPTDFATPRWILDIYHQPANGNADGSNEETKWHGPSGVTPWGTYTAQDFAGGPAPCVTPQTVVVA